MFGLIRGGESKQEEVCSLTCSLTSSSPRTKSAPLEFTMSDRNSLLSSSPVSLVSSRPAVSHHSVHSQFTVCSSDDSQSTKRSTNRAAAKAHDLPYLNSKSRVYLQEFLNFNIKLMMHSWCVPLDQQQARADTLFVP